MQKFNLRLYYDFNVFKVLNNSNNIPFYCKQYLRIYTQYRFYISFFRINFLRKVYEKILVKKKLK